MVSYNLLSLLAYTSSKLNLVGTKISFYEDTVFLHYIGLNVVNISLRNLKTKFVSRISYFVVISLTHNKTIIETYFESVNYN